MPTNTSIGATTCSGIIADIAAITPKVEATKNTNPLTIEYPLPAFSHLELTDAR